MFRQFMLQKYIFPLRNMGLLLLFWWWIAIFLVIFALFLTRLLGVGRLVGELLLRGRQKKGCLRSPFPLLLLDPLLNLDL